MSIDKTKAYRFRGDSERWESSAGNGGWICGAFFMNGLLSEHLHSRGILLEYPELPGDDWEYCECRESECGWSNDYGRWVTMPNVDSIDIYCRKKKPVYRSGCCTIIERTLSGQPFPDEVPIYWTTDPEKGKELLK